MKRWQDRGEVLDSDDEDLALDSESPEHPHKRAKILGDNQGEAQKTGDASPSGDEWMQTGVATTYTRKAKVTKHWRQTAKDARSEQPSTSSPPGAKEAVGKIALILKSSVRLEDGQTSSTSEVGESAAEDATTFFGQAATVKATIRAETLSSRSQPTSSAHVPRIPLGTMPTAGPQDTLAAPCTMRLAKPLANGAKSVSFETAVLSTAASSDLQSWGSSQVADGRVKRAVSQVISPRNPPNVCVLIPAPTSSGDAPITDHDSSGLSSPLTDCDASSPLTSISHSRPPVTGQKVDSNQLASDRAFAALAAALEADAYHAPARKRELRARKEQQLHPYLYEKAQYTKQWRSRGLQPVHYRVVDKNNAVTQDTFSDHGSESQDVPAALSSPVVPHNFAADDGLPSEESPDRARHSGSLEVDADDDELPDINSILNGLRVDGQDHRKRRRLAQSIQTGRSLQHGPLDLNHDQFDIPPSPPPTSSDSAKQSWGPTKFRMPFGMSPVPPPLPTPQLSSDVRPRQWNGHDAHSPKFPAHSRLRVARLEPPTAPIVTVDSSDETSENDDDPTSSQERVRFSRERKRIKGVLPASWLKMNLRAQTTHAPQSPSHNRRQSASPAPPTLPVKGLAQRVTRRRSNSVRRTNSIVLSDLDGSDASTTSMPAPGLRQQHLALGRNHLNVVPGRIVDDEEMETDWVDPMFSKSSRRRAKHAEPQKRQTRIDRSLEQSRSRPADFSEERRGLSYRAGESKNSTHLGSRKPKANRPRRPRLHAPQLSIADAPVSSSMSGSHAPQFIRLALRQLKGRPDHGRHSPSKKEIRLTTKEDTDDATRMLNAWRQGGIPRRSSPSKEVSSTSIGARTRPSNDDVHTRKRQPLWDISNQGQRLPTPSVGIQSTDPKRRRVIMAHKPRHGQTQLTSAVMPRLLHDEDSDQHSVLSPTKKSFIHRKHRAVPETTQYRGAQLETLEHEWDEHHRQAAFQRRINHLTAAIRHTKGLDSQIINLPLQRYLDDTKGLVAAPPTLEHSGKDREGEVDTSKSGVQRPMLSRRPRKHQPRRIDAEIRRYRQPDEPLQNVCFTANDSSAIDPPQSGPVLEGLGPFGTRYAIGFDMQPLALGTYFHESTFLGSGDFAAALDVTKRDLNIDTGRHLRIQIHDDILTWSVWTEEVASGIARIPGTIYEGLQCVNELGGDTRPEELPTVLANVDYLLRSLIRYCCKCMSFLDAVDRQMCVQVIRRFIEDTIEVLETSAIGQASLRGAKVRSWQYMVVIASMLWHLSDDVLISPETRADVHQTLTKVARALVRQVFPAGFEDLRTYYDDNMIRLKREAGIRDDDLVVSSVVILHHVLKIHGSSESAFWDALGGALGLSINTISALDKIWQDLFSLLPALELDSHGIAHAGSRFTQTQPNWSLVKLLLDRTFDLYPSTALVPGSTINNYVRAVLSRCHQLLTRWGWWKCDAMLVSVFDFFARRRLAQLHREESRGSPKFLDHLDSDPSLEVQPEDRAFHIFLKMLATGLRAMRQHYSEKKIGGIAFRFIPAHGREYRKEAEVKQTDLDALRNHLDLLCTLYFSLPPGTRPPVSLLKDLIDHGLSHREACRLSVRSWSNITAFQVSSGEPIDALQPLAVWFQEIMHTTHVQYRLAKSEAEHDFEMARAAGTSGVTQEMVDATISSNQRQIAVTMVDALAGFERAVRCAKPGATAVALVQSSTYWKVLENYDPSERRLLPVLDKALEATRTCLAKHRVFRPVIESQATTEDSQDYGDATALQELVATPYMGNDATTDIADILHEPVARLISNTFGADTTLSDTTLAMLVDVWIGIADARNRTAATTWTSYLDGYSPHAWSQFRDTEQKRKFTPYFLAGITDKIGDDFFELRATFMTAWIVSLLEREAMLKYQHLLTTALLNNQGDDDLLRNLPFSRSHRTKRFDVTPQDLSQRRLALVSCILSNMREDVDRTSRERPTAVRELRQTYANMIQHAMRTMKDHYLGLQVSENADVAGASVQGSYVEFVQHVVSFFQQYTTTICKIDTFFTESSAFPLPVGDRTYVVGRLRSYIPKLSEHGARKLLAVYVHTVSERAAVDNEQQYLVDQLCTAIDDRLEYGNPNAPSLRHVFLTAIFPAYIANALSGACSWIFAVPILQASSHMMQELLYSLDLRDDNSVEAIVGLSGAIIEALHRPLAHAVLHPGLTGLPHVQRILALVFDVGRSTLTICNHINRSTQGKLPLAQLLNKLRWYAVEVEISLTDSDEDQLGLLPVPLDVEPTQFWPDTRRFVQDQIHDSFKPLEKGGHWMAKDGQYFLHRDRQTRKEVVMNTDDNDEQRARLLESIAEFRESYGTVIEQSNVRRVVTGGLMDDLVV